MKTKEFIKRVKELGYDYEKAEEVYFIYDLEGTEIAAVCHTTPNQISNTEREWDFLNKHEQEELFDLLIEYAKTPIKDRGDTSKHIYKHNFIKTKGNSFTYLAIRQRPSISYPVLQGSSEDIFEYKVEFTDEEIEEVKKEYGIFLDDFKKLEMEDEN